MSIETCYTGDNKVLVIGIRGRFDFNSLNEFRQSYTEVENNPDNYVIDMKRTSTIDSSALGMLINMQRYLELSDRDISIINCNTDVRKIFQISCLDQKFTIT